MKLKFITDLYITIIITSLTGSSLTLYNQEWFENFSGIFSKKLKLCESSLCPSSRASQSMFSRAWTSLVANLETIRTDCRLTDVCLSEDKYRRTNMRSEKIFGFFSMKSKNTSWRRRWQIHLRVIITALVRFWREEDQSWREQNDRERGRSHQDHH